mgnify:FL=1
MSKMKVTCYGPRGSIPAPSTKRFSTIEYGGDTTCYYVEAGPFRVIQDAGSGIRTLGNDLMRRGDGFGKQFIVPLSHYHWDHLQGLPFMVPVFINANSFHFHGFPPSGHEHEGPKPLVEKMLEYQQSNPHFPVAHGALPSQRTYTDHARQFSESFWYVHHSGRYLLRTDNPEKVSAENQIKFTTIPLNHPDGCLGYRIEYMGAVLVYATDNEPLRHANTRLTNLGADPDMIITGGQYTVEQLSGMAQTFGHGSPKSCVEQARACRAKRCIIHHFDPNNDDDTLAKMEAEARAYAAELAYTAPVEFARTDMVWELG